VAVQLTGITGFAFFDLLSGGHAEKKLDIGWTSNEDGDMEDFSRAVISLVAAVRDRANAFVAGKLAASGLKRIAPAHGSIFYRLFDGRKLTMGEMATSINRDKSTVTTLVDKLVALGYAEKQTSASDARVTHVRLTEEGLGLKPLFDEISDELLETVYKGFSPEERFLLVRLLQRIIDNFTGPAE